jgi:16S rRNA (uracil1498-N3)-methyltransferase
LNKKGLISVTKSDIMKKRLLNFGGNMPRFFIREQGIEDGNITLVGEDAHHIARSLRMAVGDALTVCDMKADEYECVIESFDDDKAVHLRVLSVRHSDTEPRCRITLFQALPKGDKLDTVIQKAVECGACEIVPFESERCVVRVKADAEARKTERRNKIAAEAAKQSGRGALPTVRETVSFAEMLSLASAAGVKLFCYEGDGTLPLGAAIEGALVPDSSGRYPDVAVIVGSEGGFSPREVELARGAGLVPVGLGKRILRTETAPLFVLSCLVYLTELR